MKKIYTLLSILALVNSGTLAQTAIKSELTTTATETSAKPIASQHKSAVIWTNNFDNPADWTAEADDASHGWLITPSAVGWRPTSKIVSTSGGNYALFRNGNPSTNNPPMITGKEWNLTTATPIDLSAHPNVAFTYQIWGQRFVDDLEIQYSTDNVSWKVVDKISKNIRTVSSVQPVNDFTNPSMRYCVMPDAGGSSTLWLRIRWVNSGVAQAGNDGIAYSYQLDDFAIVEAPARELQVTETFPGSNVNQAFYYQQIPLSQAQIIEPRIVVSNVGTKTQHAKVTVTTLKDGAAFMTYTVLSDPIPSTGIDTITISTFQPTEKGLYTFNFTIEGDSKTGGVDDIESILSDNVGQEIVSIGDIYADDKDGLSWSGNYFEAFGQAGGNSAPYAEITVGQTFEIFNPAVAYGIVTVFPHGTKQVSTDLSILVELYKISKDKYKLSFEPTDMEQVSRTEYSLGPNDAFNPGDTDIYTTIRLDELVTLEPGFLYIATITAYGGEEVYNIPVYSDRNRDLSGCVRGPQTAIPENPFVIYNNFSPFIMLDFNPSSGVSDNKSPVSFSLAQNFPNPFNGTSSFGYSLTEAGKASVSITDITGKVISATDLGTKAAGSYTHTFNSNDLTAGIYFYSLVVDSVTITRKMVVSE